MISSTANVAMPAAIPDSRISGSPTISATTAPSPAAITSETKLETECCAMNDHSPGSTRCLGPVGIVITPAANAPIAAKLMCPNEITPEWPTNTYSP